MQLLNCFLLICFFAFQRILGIPLSNDNLWNHCWAFNLAFYPFVLVILHITDLNEFRRLKIVTQCYDLIVAYGNRQIGYIRILGWENCKPFDASIGSEQVDAFCPCCQLSQ